MAAPTALQCPSCSSPLQQQAFDLEQGLAKCSYCGALMSLPASAPRQPPFRERLPLALPERMDLHATPYGIVLTRRWFSLTVLFLVPFCVVWDGFLVFWYTMAVKGGAPLIFKLFPLVHVAVGVAITYYTLASLINKTRISIERGEVVITHSPLPWFGYRRIPGVMVDQVYAKMHVTHGKNGPRTNYQLWFLNTTGKHEKLHANGLTADQALYLEQQIEKALGIRDRAVPGELPRL
jgi:hypothetical protein